MSQGGAAVPPPRRARDAAFQVCASGDEPQTRVTSNAARDRGYDGVITSRRDVATMIAAAPDTGTARASLRRRLILILTTTAEGLAVNRGYAANGPCQASPDGGGCAA
jgi:hypothetical protein